MRLAALAALLALWALPGAVSAADGAGISLPTDPISLLSTFGFPTVAVIALVREIVVPGIRLTRSEAVRDEAIAGWKAQTEATKESTAATSALVRTVERLSEQVTQLLAQPARPRAGTRTQ